MILPLILTTSLWYIEAAPLSTFVIQTKTPFKQPTSFNPTVEQAKTIKFEFGWSPEPRRLNRHERLAVKLSALNFFD
jgi:hypothetical protein